MSSHLRPPRHPAPEFIVQLRAARLAAGLSQMDLCAKLGWGKGRISDYEAGYQAINPRLLEQWAQALGLTLTTQPAETHCRAESEASL